MAILLEASGAEPAGSERGSSRTRSIGRSTAAPPLPFLRAIWQEEEVGLGRFGPRSAANAYLVSADQRTRVTLKSSASIETLPAIAAVDAARWDALANPPGAPFNPFITHAFLEAMERSGSARAETGWQPCHLALQKDGALAGVMPSYVKGHSQGEYIFDHAFADAYRRAGRQYYPKLLAAAPFTPATGRRLLAAEQEDRSLLAEGFFSAAEQIGLSSAHINFLTEDEAQLAQKAGYALRIGEQFHFQDRGYGDWDGFLSALASRKRKALRKERSAMARSGLTIEWITGKDIEEKHLDAFWWFYQDTGARKWGTPYLTRSAFTMLAETMAEHMLYIFARRGTEYIAGALNLIGGDTLYGRYWGCSEHVPFLHFELCYYQAIDFALSRGLARVEAGAQGEHKIARGYEPRPIRSVHKMVDPGFHSAVADYLGRERQHVETEIELLSAHSPFSKK